MRFKEMLVLVGLVVLEAGHGSPPRCDRGPEGVSGTRSRPDGRFKLYLTGEPEFYNPGEMYTVRLSGAAKFTGFNLWAEAARGTPGKLYPTRRDTTTKYSDSCPVTLTATSDFPKSEVQALWTAPMAGTGCVTFRATVVEHQELWYQEDGPLTYTICEDEKQSNEEQPLVNHKCCACDEAKYEVSFEGLWSRQTHPKDFPDGEPTRFSDVIGASHTTEYRFWDYGGFASDGLKQVAEIGSTRMLESELKKQSQHIRTIIKARGISYPNVTGKTFAVFRVDSKHHLISLVSMIVPSPDWIVGVSGLELCLSNCSWIESKSLDMYPWDVGTDSGITYLSPDVPTDPKDHIRRITASFPADPKSPFYDPTGEDMKPLSRLVLTRQRLYEKSCDEDGMESNEGCETGEWSEWGSCSATCGDGFRTRQRFYRNEPRAQSNGCSVELTSRDPCYADVPCRTSYHEVPNRDKMPEEDMRTLCAMTEWSEWSGCSVSCGVGVKHRFRELANRKNWKRCMSLSNPPTTKQDESCVGLQGAVCTPNAELNEAKQPLASPLRSDCQVSQWSEWSPCMVTCGSGVRVRLRAVIGKTCSHLPTNESIPCTGSAGSCHTTPYQAKEICRLPRMVGACRGEFDKFFFEMSSQSCHKFSYSGCRGNRNRFDSAEECEKTCAPLKEELIRNATEKLKKLKQKGSSASEERTGMELFGKIDSASLVVTRSYDTIVTGEDGPVVDCRVGHWTPWTPCSVTCGRGYSKKTRTILVHARNGGRDCPKKVLKTKGCNSGPCSGYVQDDESNFPEYYEDTIREGCVYTEWTPWTPCSATCGLNSVQQRSRRIDSARSFSHHCIERTQTRVCNVLPCSP